jgi:hypothetical protein
MAGIVAGERNPVVAANSLIEDTASAFFSEMHGHQVRDCGCPLRRASLLDLTFARCTDAAHSRC